MSKFKWDATWILKDFAFWLSVYKWTMPLHRIYMLYGIPPSHMANFGKWIHNKVKDHMQHIVYINTVYV